jgi:hypothetical protein
VVENPQPGEPPYGDRETGEKNPPRIKLIGQRSAIRISTANTGCKRLRSIPVRSLSASLFYEGLQGAYTIDSTSIPQSSCTACSSVAVVIALYDSFARSLPSMVVLAK